MSQALQSRRARWSDSLRWVYAALVAGLLILAVTLQSSWVPQVRGWISPASDTPEKITKQEAKDEHEGHDHAGHDDPNSIELSEQGRKNIGLTIAKVKLSPFERSITVPGMIVEKPGQSTLDATAPLTGIVTRIHVIEGSVVVPGDPLFDIRLTHEELVQAQANLLKTSAELRVTAKEIKRIEAITADGAIPRKTLLDRQYEQQKQQAQLRSQEQALRLHGLSEEQVRGILEEGKLVSELTVRVPEPATKLEEVPVYQVSELQVTQGQNVETGATLAILADHSELFIEGDAFESDLPFIARANSQEWPVSARIEAASEAQKLVSNLKVLYVAGKVDPGSRTLHFYVSLPNEKLRDTKSDGHRFVSWRFRPGQRVQIQVPVEQWEDRIVLPLAAVAQDGVENYVFVPNGDRFHRRAVHVEFRDTQSVVVANNGSIFPGTPIAMSGAQQLQIAVKNKSGGAVDPHAGHSH